ncbi:MAG TPA: stage V sporulation protein B [Pseudogracilibacillus sp.]|nr:stage V sporulation protein B [Pseudogracilibacillus sp.]
MTKQSFLHGTLLLIIAGMITRGLGFINRIVIARLIGEEGVGLYMMALPSLFLMLTLTQIGLPAAISKRIAEANELGDQQKIKQIMTFSFFIIACTSIIFTIIMFFLAPFVANYLMTDERTLYPLYAVLPSISVIAFVSVIKGYFQGMQNMKPQSIAIIIEQVVRIISIYFILTLLTPYGIEFAAAGAMIGVFIGEIVSFFYLFYLFKREKTIPIRKKFVPTLRESKSIRKQLFSIALPNTGSRFISSISNFLEPILVSQSLRIAGLSTVQATRQYGELTGYVMPLLYLPTFITNSLSIALLPSISAADASGNRNLVFYRIHQAIRISFASGALATIILTFFSIPILTQMYGTSNASKYIVIMAPCFLFLYIQAPLQAALFALDLAKYAMHNSFYGSVIKFSLLFVLASNEKFGIFGVVIALNTTIILITLLHLYVLHREINFILKRNDVIKMMLLLLLTGAVTYIFKISFATYLSNVFVLIFIFICLTGIYIVFLLLLRFITREELRQIPFIKQFF